MNSMEDFIHAFLKSALKSEDFKVYSLAGDASNRRYYRVILDHHSWVLMRWDPFDPEKYPFLSVLTHFAKAGVHVPEVVAMAPKEGLMLLEDLGDLTLERKFQENQNHESSLEFYKMAVDEIVKIHHKATALKGPCTAFDIKFDTEKFLWEMNYGRENLIEGVLKFKFSDASSKEIQKIFIDICTKLDEEPKKIAHRDYHSRNLMIKLDEMKVIDFQDARLGPIQYDLVSLFRDSYVNMNDEMTSTLMEYYLDSSREFLPKNFSRAHFDEVYELQSIQRCFKACGSFASFYNLREDKRYLKYLSFTLTRVLKSLTNFAEYKPFVNVLIDSGALERKYELL